eukprot:SM000138S00051  [mRNA]  locus=s138:195746:202172:- [translate_table: standard]
MAKVVSAVEDDLLARAAEDGVPWDRLPKRLKLYLGSRDAWLRRQQRRQQSTRSLTCLDLASSWLSKTKEHCIKKRYRWSKCAAKNVCKEYEYYEDLMRHVKKNQSLFPYHLAEDLCRIIRVSPFNYYCDMLYEVLKSERSYDSIPNFSAADALRETGVGRNQYIDLMNKCRSKMLWRVNKSFVKEMLPSQPIQFPLEPWWHVNVVNLTHEEFRKLSEEESVLVKTAAKDAPALVGEFNIDTLRELYNRGLIYFDVPVFPDDIFHISTLEGFVSNTNQAYEDEVEGLLYSLFVAFSERATVEELATTLQANLERLGAAVSLACRLGWARKVMNVEAILDDVDNEEASAVAERNLGLTDRATDKGLKPSLSADQLADAPKAAINRIAFLVDANLTSYLMMGSLSPGAVTTTPSLKQQAVTLFEAGKLGDRQVMELCNGLRGLEGTKLEGELQHFANHAESLRCALEYLSTGQVAPATSGKDQDRGESLAAEDEEMAALGVAELKLDNVELAGHSTLKAADVQRESVTESLGSHPGLPQVGDSTSFTEWATWGPREKTDGDQAPDDGNEFGDWETAAASSSGVGKAEVEGPTWAESWEQDAAASGGAGTTAWPSLDGAALSRTSQGMAASGDRPLLSLNLIDMDTALSSSPREDGGEAKDRSSRSKMVQEAARYKVDVLRSESLAGLPPPTLRRVLRREYSTVVSMAPLAAAPALHSGDAEDGGEGPAHFGPPCAAATSPWMALLLYAATGSGPVTLALVRGQRLRKLPPPLGGCRRASVWTWDASALGGIGGKAEGSLVDGSVLLHVLNSLLRLSAVLVQPYPAHGGSFEGPPGDSNVELVTCDVPLPISSPARDSVAAAEIASPYGDCQRAARVVATRAGLHTIGYLRLLRVLQRARSGTGASDDSSQPQDGAVLAQGGAQLDGAEDCWVAARLRPSDNKALPPGVTWGWVPLGVSFGIPLFDTQLCRRVCENAAKLGMLEAPRLQEHGACMAGLRGKLRSFISDLKPNGPVSMAAYKPGVQSQARLDGSEGFPLSSKDWSRHTDAADIPVLSPRISRHDPWCKPEYTDESLNHLESVLVGFENFRYSRQASQPCGVKRDIADEQSTSTSHPPDRPVEDEDILPGVNFIFNGATLAPYNIGSVLQGRLPAALITEAATLVA